MSNTQEQQPPKKESPGKATEIINLMILAAYSKGREKDEKQKEVNAKLGKLLNLLPADIRSEIEELIYFGWDRFKAAVEMNAQIQEQAQRIIGLVEKVDELLEKLERQTGGTKKKFTYTAGGTNAYLAYLS